MRSDRQPAGLIAEALAARGTRVAFGMPGGGANLDLVGALRARGIDFVLGHGETATCIMAATYGHVSGAPSCAVVTRGPGAASAVNGAAQATLDRYPLVLVTDTVAERDRPRVAHQRLEQRDLLSPVSKATWRIGADVSGDDLSRAFDLACDEPPGCVHLDYDADATTSRPLDIVDPVGTSPAIEPAELRRRIGIARRPLVIVGRGVSRSYATDLVAVLERFGAPVLTTYQAVGFIPTDHPLNGGLFTNAAAERPLLDDADLIVTVGLDPVEPIPAPWRYSAPAVSISPLPTTDPYVPYEGELVGSVVEILADAIAGDHDWDAVAGASHREHLRAALRERGASLGPVELVDTVGAMRPAALTTTVDAGAHFLAVMPLWDVAEPDRLLVSNGLATMGYAVPAAIGIALARPGQPVLAFVGDGGLGMTLAELETIARLGLPITVIVFNDATLSLIEVKQRADHGGRQAVGFLDVDFAAAARALRVEAHVVTTTEQVAEVLAGDWLRPRLVDARIDPAPYRHLIAVTRG